MITVRLSPLCGISAETALPRWRGLPKSPTQKHPQRILSWLKLRVESLNRSGGPLDRQQATSLESGMDWRQLLGIFLALTQDATLISIPS